MGPMTRPIGSEYASLPVGSGSSARSVSALFLISSSLWATRRRSGPLPLAGPRTPLTGQAAVAADPRGHGRGIMSPP